MSLYPLILSTHLNPFYFKHYVLKIRKFTLYTKYSASQGMIKLLRNRNHSSVQKHTNSLLSMLHFHTEKK